MSYKRLLFLELALFVFAAGIIGRLFYWQILKHENFLAAAKTQIENTVNIGAQRGKILSSDGSILVSNQKAYLVYAILPEINKLKAKDKNEDTFIKEIVERLTPILLEEKLSGKEKVTQKYRDVALAEIKAYLDSQLRQKDLIWVPLAKKITEETKKKIESLKIKGIGFENDTQRFYPDTGIAANLLGFVGKNSEGNDKGYFGLEGYYDKELGGRPGRLVQQVDSFGKPILAAPLEGVKALNGSDLLTTIDRTVQYTVEKKLKDGVERFGAKGGAVIILDTKTGAVLSSVSYPTFNPLDAPSYKPETYKNLGMSEIFEPGSTFKAVTFSSALDANAINTNTICPCNGPIKVSGYEITTWNNKFNPNSTPAQILLNSDNVGAGFAGQKLGTNRFLQYIKDFNFGSVLGIDLQGEEAGILKERKDWSEVDLVTASFGQGLSVTALQMTSALATIANDGKLMKPYVVKKIIGPKGEVEFKPKEIRQVIEPATAATMKELLLAAVEGGRPMRGILRGYRVAGKTGTAQVPIEGKYSGKTIASFVGFGPVENPKFAAIVVLFEPSASIWAVETAEPLFFDIIKDLYPYWGIQVRQ